MDEWMTQVYKLANMKSIQKALQCEDYKFPELTVFSPNNLKQTWLSHIGDIMLSAIFRPLDMVILLGCLS